MPKQPLISVIIPIYNTAPYLARCLDSVICTNYDNLEIICVNDGSTDNSITILKDYKERDDRFIIIDVENGGLSKSRNLGLEIAKGEYICFIDSDDWIHKQFFDVLLFCIEKTRAAIAVCTFKRTSTIPIDDNIDKGQVTVSIFEKGAGLNDHTVKGHVWGRIINRSVINSNRFAVGLQTAEDTLFNLELFADNPELTTVLADVPLYYYFYREGSIINTDKGLDFLKFSYIYLERVGNAEDKRTVELFLNEAFKNTLSVRYAVMFYKEMSIKDEVNQLIKRCLAFEKQKMPFTRMKALSFKLFAYFPFTYRLFRIINDPTMLDWEKNQKRERRKK